MALVNGIFSYLNMPKNQVVVFELFKIIQYMKLQFLPNYIAYCLNYFYFQNQ